MSESTTPSDKKVPGAQPPWAPGNRAKPTCAHCNGWLSDSLYATREGVFLCRYDYEATIGPIVDV